jgi:hypothetical protein
VCGRKDEQGEEEEEAGNHAAGIAEAQATF